MTLLVATQIISVAVGPVGAIMAAFLAILALRKQPAEVAAPRKDHPDTCQIS